MILMDFLQGFHVRQRRSCLDKAETMMKELKPQFEHFLKVLFKNADISNTVKLMTKRNRRN